MRFLVTLLLFSGLTFQGFSNSYEELFDSKMISFYKIDSCKVFVQEPGDDAPVLRYIYVFNQQGLMTQRLKLPMYEDEDTTITTYEYVNGLLVQELTPREGREPFETLYFYKGRTPYRKVVKAFDTKDYKVFADDEALILGLEGMGMVAAIDSATGQVTDRMVEGKIDEYEYRYNRFKKLTRVVYYYQGVEFSNTEYDYGPNANQPLQSKTIYKMGSRVPDSKLEYVYAGSSLPVKELNTDAAAGGVITTTFEYIYNKTSPVLQPAIAPKGAPLYSPVKKKVK